MSTRRYHFQRGYSCWTRLNWRGRSNLNVATFVIARGSTQTPSPFPSVCQISLCPSYYWPTSHISADKQQCVFVVDTRHPGVAVQPRLFHMPILLNILPLPYHFIRFQQILCCCCQRCRRNWNCPIGFRGGKSELNVFNPVKDMDCFCLLDHKAAYASIRCGERTVFRGIWISEQELELLSCEVLSRFILCQWNIFSK